MKTILLIAYKFNDILYARTTKEYSNAAYKKLLIIYRNNQPEDYPFISEFDEVKSFKLENTIAPFIKNIYNINRLKSFLRCDIIMANNPMLLNVRYIIHKSTAKKFIAVEDGSMNYYPVEDIVPTKPPILKHLVEVLLGINERKIMNMISVTYLLKPEAAVTYWGNLRKIDFADFPSLNLNEISIINGKRIFVGTPIYLTHICSISDYNKIVNRIIKDYEIDFYIPHWAGSSEEAIDASILNLNNLKVTLEMLSTKYTFDIISFATSSLFTCKHINPNIRAFAINEFSSLINNIPVYKDAIDGYL